MADTASQQKVLQNLYEGLKRIKLEKESEAQAGNTGPKDAKTLARMKKRDEIEAGLKKKIQDLKGVVPK